MRQSGFPITLTTDFGHSDEYVGVMKGVILSVNKGIQIVDLVHEIPPHNIPQAARLIWNNYRYFPDGTVHIGVVDPGVGSSRRVIAVQCDTHYFIGPDNGIFTPVLTSKEPVEVYHVENRKLFLKKISNTFHGRDIMAPVAARLASGMAIAQVGKRLAKESCVLISMREPVLQANGISGEVISVDRFGNIRTNVTKSILKKISLGEEPRLFIKSYAIEISSGPYSDLDINVPTAIINSSGELEICVRDGSAAELLDVARGEHVFVRGHHYTECINIGLIEHGLNNR